MEQLPSRDHKISIPEQELTYEYFRSSGPGGQNVNKVTTGVRIRFNIEQSQSFTPEEKQRIRMVLKNRINDNDELLIENEESRSQFQNRNNAYNNLITLISEALIEEKERVPTKIPHGEKQKRLEEKKKISEKKKLRQIKPEDFE